MLPFALLVLVFLLLLFKFINSGTQADVDGSKQVVRCGQGSEPYEIKKGETCWQVAQTCGLGLDELLALEGNEEIECENLAIGQGICVPVSE
jgi:hypothetical protein